MTAIAKVANIIRLVPKAVDRRSPVDHNTMEALTQLLEMARRGDLIGVAFVGMRTEGFFIDTAGEADRNLAFAAGCVSALSADLIRRMSSTGGSR